MILTSLNEEILFKYSFLKAIKDWYGAQCFTHLVEISNDDIKLKKAYNKVKKIEQAKCLDTHDALCYLIVRRKI